MSVKKIITKVFLFLRGKSFWSESSALEEGINLWEDYKTRSKLNHETGSKIYTEEEIEKILLAIEDQNKRFRDWSF